jgi:hypothetical protein
MSSTLGSTSRSSHYSTMGASLKSPVGPRDTKQRSKVVQSKRPNLFSNERTPNPRREHHSQRRHSGDGDDRRRYSFGSISGSPQKPIETLVWMEIDNDIVETGMFIYRLVDRHRHEIRNFNGRPTAHRPGAALDGIWLALFPTAQCKCCTLPTAHFYAQKCAWITYKQFDPAKTSCWSSVYGSDGRFMYWSRIIRDINSYAALVLTSGADAREIHLALKVWDGIMSRAERELRTASDAALGSSNANMPMVAGKCRMVSVPAPTPAGKDVRQNGRKRIIWARCQKSSCKYHDMKVMRNSNGVPTTEARVFRMTSDPPRNVDKIEQTRLPGESKRSSRPFVPMSTIAELDED